MGVKDFQAAARTVTSPANTDCGLIFIMTPELSRIALFIAMTFTAAST